MSHGSLTEGCEVDCKVYTVFKFLSRESVASQMQVWSSIERSNLSSLPRATYENALLLHGRKRNEILYRVGHRNIDMKK